MRWALPGAALAAAAAPVGAQTYLAGALGTSQTAASDVRLVNPETDLLFRAVRWGIHPFQPTIYFSVKAGRFFPERPRWGIEFDYTHNKAVAFTAQPVRVEGADHGQPVSATAPMERHVQALRFTNGVNLLSLRALYRASGPEARWQPYAALGPAYALLWSRNRVGDQEATGRYRGVGWGWTGGVGIRGRLRGRLGLYAEWKYSSTPARSWTAQGGRLDTRLRTGHQSAGLFREW